MTLSQLKLTQNPDRDKMRLRIIFGCLSGLVLALIAWGMDAYTLQKAHSYLPWIKFALGTIIVIPLYGLCGYCISRLGARHLVIILCFGTCAFLIAWVASHLSFDLYNKLIGWVNPGLATRIEFTYDAMAHGRFVLLAIILVVLFAILSVFYELLINQAYSAQAKTSLCTSLFVILVFFTISGYLLDYFNNQSQRPPITQTAYYLSRAQKIQKGELAYDRNLMSRERVFLDLNIDLNRSYKLAQVSYNALLHTTSVYILFDNEWYDCMVVEDQPFYCEATAYAK